PLAMDAVDVQGYGHWSVLPGARARVRAMPALMAVEVVAEHAQPAREQRRGAVRVMARASSDDLRRPASEVLEVVGQRPADCEPIECRCHGAQAEDARSALARALRRHIADNSLGGSHAAGIGLQQTDEAAAEAKSGLAEVDRIQRRPPQGPDRSP